MPDNAFFWLGGFITGVVFTLMAHLAWSLLRPTIRKVDEGGDVNDSDR